MYIKDGFKPTFPLFLTSLLCRVPNTRGRFYQPSYAHVMNSKWDKNKYFSSEMCEVSAQNCDGRQS